MTNITNAFTPEVTRLDTWDVPGSTAAQKGLYPAIPRGKVIWTGQSTVPVVGAGDSQINSWTFTFPPNFAYLIIDMQMIGVAPAILDWERGKGNMVGRIWEGPAADLQVWWFVMKGGQWTTSSTALPTYDEFVRYQFTGNEFFQSFYPTPFPKKVIDAGTQAQIRWDWMNADAAETAETVMQFYVSALMFTIDQMREFPLHTVQNINPSTYP